MSEIYIICLNICFMLLAMEIIPLSKLAECSEMLHVGKLQIFVRFPSLGSRENKPWGLEPSSKIIMTRWWWFQMGVSLNGGFSP